MTIFLYLSFFNSSLSSRKFSTILCVYQAPNGNESQTSENVVDSVTQKHNASTALRAQQSNGSLLDLEQQLTTIQEVRLLMKCSC